MSGEILRLNESVRTVADSSSDSEEVEEEDDDMGPPDQPVPGGNAAGNAGNAGNADAQGAGNAAAAARPETKPKKNCRSFMPKNRHCQPVYGSWIASIPGGTTIGRTNRPLMP